MSLASEREALNNSNGIEWPELVGEIWEANRSRFATAWDDLPHHDRVSIYRILLRKDAA